MKYIIKIRGVDYIEDYYLENIIKLFNICAKHVPIKELEIVEVSV